LRQKNLGFAMTSLVIQNSRLERTLFQFCRPDVGR
jgi:hypothetical protein